MISIGGKLSFPAPLVQLLSTSSIIPRNSQVRQDTHLETLFHPCTTLLYLATLHRLPSYSSTISYWQGRASCNSCCGIYAQKYFLFDAFLDMENSNTGLKRESFPQNSICRSAAPTFSCTSGGHRESKASPLHWLSNSVASHRTNLVPLPQKGTCKWHWSMTGVQLDFSTSKTREEIVLANFMPLSC